jgi:hypothetical protein
VSCRSLPCTNTSRFTGRPLASDTKSGGDGAAAGPCRLDHTALAGGTPVSQRLGEARDTGARGVGELRYLRYEGSPECLLASRPSKFRIRTSIVFYLVLWLAFCDLRLYALAPLQQPSGL